MGRHDSGYRLLFSFPYFVECLVRGFVPGDWVEQLDFGTLEAVREGHPRDSIGMRSNDVIWRLRWRGLDVWVYVYLMIELQKTDEPFMAVRVLDYEGGLYRQIVRALQLKRGDPLPIVLPLVLYHGYPAWKSATEVFDLIAPAPPEIEPYLPHLRYLLLDVNTYPAGELERMRNPVACVFQLEGSTTLDWEPIDRLVELLPEPEHSELQEAAAQWLRHVFLPSRLPGVTLPEVSKLEEISTMIAEHSIDWSTQWREEGREQGRQEGREQGRQEGRQEGREQGRQEGEAAVLLRQLQRKFGSLSPEILESVRHADAGQLLDWADRVVTAATIEEIFNGAGDA
jgi:Putative transposase, YhgA-like/Domain of unknown function (DUF4351)